MWNASISRSRFLCGLTLPACSFRSRRPADAPLAHAVRPSPDVGLDAEARVVGVVDDVDLARRDVDESLNVALRTFRHRQHARRALGCHRDRRPRVMRQRQRLGGMLRKHQVNGVVDRDDRRAGHQRRQHVVRRVKQVDALALERQRNPNLLGERIVPGRLDDRPEVFPKAPHRLAIVGPAENDMLRCRDPSAQAREGDSGCRCRSRNHAAFARQCRCALVLFYYSDPSRRSPDDAWPGGCAVRRRRRRPGGRFQRRRPSMCSRRARAARGSPDRALAAMRRLVNVRRGPLARRSYHSVKPLVALGGRQVPDVLDLARRPCSAVPARVKACRSPTSRGSRRRGESLS